jgi:hypothetical protein
MNPKPAAETSAKRAPCKVPESAGDVDIGDAQRKSDASARLGESAHAECDQAYEG